MTPLRSTLDRAHEANRRAAQLAFPSRRATLPAAIEHQLPALSTDETQLLTTRLPTGPARAGIHRRVPDTARQMGRWAVLDNGQRVWRLGIQSTGAAGIRVHFRGFAAGAGKVWVHAAGDTGSSDAVGPYTGRGLFDDGDFWTGAVLSESIVVEYEPADGDTATQDPPFTIGEVSHLSADVFPGARAAGNAAPRAAAASCNLDVTCHPEWADSASAVAHIQFESSQGSFLCSGTLLNTRNSSLIPYFLTANHCIGDDETARSVEAYWFYQTSTCDALPPSRSSATRVVGARWLAGDGRSGGDFALIRLSEAPGGVYYSGWDPSDLQDGAAATAIHHPAGDYKRISFGSRVVTTYTPINKFYNIQWSRGLVEGGSSGSGLFSSPLVLAGVLSAGPKFDTTSQACAALPFAVYYGRFSAIYPVIRGYLEDRTAGTAPPPANGGPVLTSGTPRSIVMGPVAGGTLYNGTSGFRIDVPQGATRLEIRVSTTPDTADVDLFARFGTDVVVSEGSVVADVNSTGPRGEETIVLTPTSSPALRAGTYYIGLALFTRDETVTSTVTATVTTGGGTTPSAGGVLTSGTPRSISLGPVAGGTLFSGPSGFRIDVPEGAARLEIKLTSTPASADVDLYARFGTDVVVSGGSVVADVSSSGLRGEETIVLTSSSSPALRAGTYFIALALFTRNETVTSTVTATVTTGGGPPPAGGVLTSGTPRSITLGPVSGGTLYNGTSGFRIDVPQGATRLEIRLASNPSSADVDLYARFGADVGLSNGNVVADVNSAGLRGDELIVLTPSSSPPLRAGTYFIAVALFTRDETVTATVTATVTTGGTGPTGGGVLTSGTPRSITLGPVSGGTLFNGSNGFRIDVPQGATRLEIRLTSTPASADVDLYARFGTDVTVSAGSVVADLESAGLRGDELIVLTPSSSPPLRAGTYFIALALFTRDEPVTSTVTATVTGGGTGTGPGGGGVLTSGTPRSINLGPVSGGTLFNGSSGFRIDVPQGATRLEIKLTSTPASADVDLYARFGTDVTVSAGSVVADLESAGLRGDELIVLTPTSSPALRAGTYYIALALFTRDEMVTATVTATVTTGGGTAPPGGGVLTSGTPRSISLGPVTVGTLFSGANSFRIDVPQGATRLEIKLATTPESADVDLYVRHGSDVQVSGGTVVADINSAGLRGDELLILTPTSSPALRAGTYYIALALFTRDVAVTSTVTATVTTGGGTPTSAVSLTSDTPAQFSLPAASSPTLFTGQRSFKIEAPEGTQRLRVRLNTTTPNADVDLFIRYGADPAVLDGAVVADFESSGTSGVETIEITSESSPPLRAGTYYISLAQFTTGLAAEGTVTATVQRASAAPPPSAAARLVSGVAAPFALSATDSPTLYAGTYGFRIDVPAGAEGLEIVLQSNDSAGDLDLFARYGEDPAVVNGRVLADHYSTGLTGNERIVIMPAGHPALRQGTYYIAVAQYTTGVDARATVTATILGASSTPAAMTKFELHRGLEDAKAKAFELPRKGMAARNARGPDDVVKGSLTGPELVVKRKARPQVERQ